MSILLAEGHVYHGREEGVKHRFRYPIFYALFSSRDEAELMKLFKSQFKGLLSFQLKDYLRGDNESVDESIRKFLKDECSYEAEDVQLLTLPRMFGYAFNPVSFWLARRRGQLEAVLCEVNNTFGERHFYWICPAQGVVANQWYEAQKVFHVSPFFPVDGFYRFRFQISSERFHIDINYFNSDNKLRLATWLRGTFSPFEKTTRSRLFLRYGWMTLLIFIRIHIHAFLLWRYKIPFFKKPVPPNKGVTS